MTDQLPLKDRVALVVGASRGIGYESALALAKAGAHVIATARTEGGLEELDDAVFAATPPPPPGDDWRADVTTLLTERRAALLRHPWSAVMRRRPAVGPGFLSWMEFLQATLTRAGFTSRDVTAASWVLYSHVQGSAASQATLRWSAAERREGQLMLERHSASYPTLAAQRHLLDDDWDTNFALGLAYVLDGLTARAAAGAT